MYLRNIRKNITSSQKIVFLIVMIKNSIKPSRTLLNDMKINCIKTSITLVVLLIACLGTRGQPVVARLDSLTHALYTRGQFNGSILVSMSGKKVYEGSYGKADLKTNADFTDTTPCYLASVSKQFTAMAIMMLREKKLLSYDDPVVKYLPELSPFAQSVTIRHLLNHTSGIVNYESLGIDHPGLSNQEVYNRLIKEKSLRFSPGDKYEYSNSGYVLLALIIEKVSGMSYAEFMDKYIFAPCGMSDSFVFDRSTAHRKFRVIGYGKFGDIDDNPGFTVGDGGICSTIEDMRKWDKALYGNQLVSQSTLSEAFSPAVLNNGTTAAYGFGWMLKNENDDPIVYHTGGSGGFRTYVERNLRTHNTIIILTNTENSPRTEISDAIVNILANRPYVLPRQSVSVQMFAIRDGSGIDSAISFYITNKQKNSNAYNFDESELNSLGYKLWSINKLDEAIVIFKLNVTAYPNSSNAYESLGEACLQHGDRKQAETAFQKALLLDPKNEDAIRMLKKMNGP